MDTGERATANRTLLDYASILRTLDESIHAHQSLSNQQAALQSENQSLSEHSRFQQAQTKDLIAQFQASKDSLAQKNNQLARLYLDLLNSQYGLAKDNVSLLKHVEVLNTLRDCDRSMRSSSVQTADLIRSERQSSFAAFVNSAKDQITAQQNKDQSFLQAVLDRQTLFNKTMVESMVDVAEQQARNFKAKLLLVMELAYSCMAELNGRIGHSDEKPELLVLGKRCQSSSEEQPSKFDFARLSSQNTRLAAENKYLLYVLQCFQNKILELKVPNFPKSMLNTEYLLKNQSYLSQTETPLFLSLSELYDSNQRLQDELNRYRTSRFFSGKEHALPVNSLQELREEYRIISEQFNFDQEKVFALIISKLRERITGQESHLHLLQTQLIELQTQGRNKLLELEALSKRLSQTESERSRLIEHISALDKIHDEYKSIIDLKLKSSGLDPSDGAEKIKHFIDQVIEHTSLVHSYLNPPSRAEPYELESQQLVNQLVIRQTAENKRLSFELEKAKGFINALEAEKEALTFINQQLEAEVRKNNANEQIETLRKHLEEKTTEINEMGTKWASAQAGHQEKISELQSMLENLSSELQTLRREAGARYQEQIQILLGKERELESRLSSESASARESFRRTLEAKDLEISNLKLRVAELETGRQQDESRLTGRFTQEKYDLERQLQIQQNVLNEYKAKRNEEEQELERLQREAIDSKKSEFELSLKRKEGELNDLMQKVKTLEHELQIVHVTRDNFIGILQQAFEKREGFAGASLGLNRTGVEPSTSKMFNDQAA